MIIEIYRTSDYVEAMEKDEEESLIPSIVVTSDKGSVVFETNDEFGEKFLPLLKSIRYVYGVDENKNVLSARYEEDPVNWAKGLSEWG